MPSDSCYATPSVPRNRSEVATQTSLQHGSRMPSDSCYATPSAPRNRSEVATQTSLQHGSRRPSDSCYATPSAPRNRSEVATQTSPPTWQPQAFRQLPPGLRKPSKEHFLIFHRYSTELFRGWACLLDFCKPLANMGPCKMVNVSAFGTPSLLK